MTVKDIKALRKELVKDLQARRYRIKKLEEDLNEARLLSDYFEKDLEEFQLRHKDVLI